MAQRPGGNKTSTITIERRERMAKALDLRRDSWTYQEIARELGISRTQAFKDVDEAIKEITAEPAAHTLKFELERLDLMQRPLFEVITAVDAVREIEGEAIRVANIDNDLAAKDFDRELEKTVKRTDANINRMFQAIDRSLKIQDRRAKYLALYPKDAQTDVTVSDVKAWLNDKLGTDDE
ncbi:MULTISPECIES: hypothetical protein [Rhodococcus]|uniref:hypothetical protein n=1 Tax=Rhodococcus TaxID=1827 RepID=UPI0007AE648A|nr:MULTISPECIES: hypothetical protein [Rhodococcus]KZL33214.1 hypothetical protein A3852_13040 [Rhodococcus qingshengii]MCE4161626.1 hypothetical protein [Rhodococcus sp. Ni2]